MAISPSKKIPLSLTPEMLEMLDSMVSPNMRSYTIEQLLWSHPFFAKYREEHGIKEPPRRQRCGRPLKKGDTYRQPRKKEILVLEQIKKAIFLSQEADKLKLRDAAIENPAVISPEPDTKPAPKPTKKDDGWI